MHPILIDFGQQTLFGFTFHPRVGGYGFMYAMGVIVGWLMVVYLGRQVDRDKPWTDMIFLSIIAGVIGGRLVNALTRLPDILSGQVTFLDVVLGGGVWLGGAVCGSLTFVWFLWRYDVPYGIGTNLLFVAIPPAHAVGRIGCLLGGCCYGAPTDLPWGITYTNELAHRMMGTPLHIPLHPMPIYEFLVEMTLFVVGFVMWNKKARPFSIAVVWLAGYGLARFAMEFFRADYRGSLGTLSTSQWISLMLVGAALAILFGPMRGKILHYEAPDPRGKRAEPRKS